MTKKLSDPKELTRLLKDYWLVTDDSPMMDIVKTAIKAKQIGDTVRFVFKDSFDVGLKEALDAVGVLNEVFPVDNDPTRQFPFGTHEVPALHERFADFSLMLPFCVHRWHLKDKANRDPLKYKFETDWIVLVQYLLKQKYRIEDIIDSYLSASENGIIVCGISGSGNTEDFQRGFYLHLRRLSVPALVYLGLTHYALPVALKDTWLNRAAIETWQLEFGRQENTRTQQEFKDRSEGTSFASNLYAAYGADGNMMCRPKCDSDQFAEMNAIGQIAANLYILTGLPSFPDDSRVWDYFNIMLFLKGGDAQVRTEMGFKSSRSLAKFLTENHISLQLTDKALEPAEVYKRWEEAREVLGVPAHPTEVTSAEMSAAQVDDKLEGFQKYVSAKRLNYINLGVKLTDSKTIEFSHAKRKWFFSYIQLGFRHQGKTDKPVASWDFLVELLRNHGTFQSTPIPVDDTRNSAGTFSSRKKGDSVVAHVPVYLTANDKKLKERLSKQLGRITKIEADPFYPWSKRDGYALRMKVLDPFK